MMKVATHSGSFHADDVMAVAILSELFSDIEIVRTRDKDVMATADLVVDVGGVYEPTQGRYDHHQTGGAGARTAGKRIPYAGCGLIWLHYGEKLCENKAIADMVDYCLISAIDAQDVGVGSNEGFSFSNAISTFNPTWEEDQSEEAYFIQFEKAVAFARQVLVRSIKAKTGAYKASSLVLKSETQHQGKVLVLDQFLPWQGTVGKQMPDCLYVVFPSSSRGWMVQAVSGLQAFSKRKALPAHWGGLMDAEFAEVVGVRDALFCHTGLFICGALSKEGALQLASLAVSA